MLALKKSSRRNLQKKKAKFFTLKEKFREKHGDYIKELNVNNFKFFRTISLCTFYDVDGGLPISDHLLNTAATSGGRSIMAEFNEVTNFTEIMYDKNLKIFSISVDYKTINRAPISLLIERLQTLNDLEAHRLSKNLSVQIEAINRVKSMLPIPKDCPSLLFDPYQIPPPSDRDYQDYREKTKAICKKYIDRPFLGIRSRRDNLLNTMKIVEFEINEKMVDLLGYEQEKFIQRILKRGFPLIFGDTQSIRGINNIIEGLNKKNLGEEVQMDYEIISEKYGLIPAKAMIEISVFMKDNLIEFYTLQHFEIQEVYLNRIDRIKTEKSTTVNFTNEKKGENEEKHRTIIIEDLPFREESMRMISRYYPKINIAKEKKTQIYRCEYKKI